MLTKDHFSSVLSKSHLPKNNRWKDWFNGMGITVHDVNSAEISIEELTFQGDKYDVVTKYSAQGHFGLDKEEILKKLNSIAFSQNMVCPTVGPAFRSKTIFQKFLSRYNINTRE